MPSTENVIPFVLAWVAGAVLTFIVVLIESKMEERPGVSSANTFGIFIMAPLFWPFMLLGFVWRRFHSRALD